MQKKLYDYDIDEQMDLYLLIKDAKERLAKNGKAFIAFTFQDKSGQMDAKYWDASKEDIATFTEGSVVHLTGKRELYQGNPQIRIYSLRLAGAGEPTDLATYVKSAPMSREEMEAEINQAVFEITNPTMNRIVRYILKKYHEEYFTAPAAKSIHHAYAGGLAYHTVSMLRLARFLVEAYDLNASILFSGLLIHDLGKVREMTGPVATEYTLEGNLVGHIAIVNEEITKACQALKIDDSSEDVLVLRHMVLSHHGKREYGSPVEPRIIEAEVLHSIDDLDASINQIQDALKRTEEGHFSERLFGMDGRSFYKPNIKHT